MTVAAPCILHYNYNSTKKIGNQYGFCDEIRQGEELTLINCFATKGEMKDEKMEISHGDDPRNVDASQHTERLQQKE